MALVVTNAGRAAINAASSSESKVVIDRIDIGTLNAGQRYNAQASAVGLVDNTPQSFTNGIDLEASGVSTIYNISIGVTAGGIRASEIGFYDGNTLIMLWANQANDVFNKPATETILFTAGYNYASGDIVSMVYNVQPFPLANDAQADAGTSNAVLLTPRSGLRTVKAWWDSLLRSGPLPDSAIPSLSATKIGSGKLNRLRFPDSHVGNQYFRVSSSNTTYNAGRTQPRILMVDNVDSRGAVSIAASGHIPVLAIETVNNTGNTYVLGSGVVESLNLRINGMSAGDAIYINDVRTAFASSGDIKVGIVLRPRGGVLYDVFLDLITPFVTSSGASTSIEFASDAQADARASNTVALSPRSGGRLVQTWWNAMLIGGKIRSTLIPNLNANFITSGIFANSRLPDNHFGVQKYRVRSTNANQFASRSSPKLVLVNDVGTDGRVTIGATGHVPVLAISFISTGSEVIAKGTIQGLNLGISGLSAGDDVRINDAMTGFVKTGGTKVGVVTSSAGGTNYDVVIDLWSPFLGEGDASINFNYADRVTSRDFTNILPARTNGRTTMLTGIWSDGKHMYVCNDSDDKIYAFDFNTKARAPDRDFDLGSPGISRRYLGIWSDGVNMYVSVYQGGTIRAYDFNTKQRNASRDFLNVRDFTSDGRTRSANPQSIFSDGVTMYALFQRGLNIRAYDFTSRNRVSSRDITLSEIAVTGSSCYLDINDNKLVYFRSSTDMFCWIINHSTISQILSFKSSKLIRTDSNDALWTDGINLYSLDSGDRSIYAYDIRSTL